MLNQHQHPEVRRGMIFMVILLSHRTRPAWRRDVRRKPVVALSPPKRNSTRRHPNLTDNAIRRVTDCIISATRHAKTCKTKVRSKWKRKTNYAGYVDWTALANGNLWT